MIYRKVGFEVLCKTAEGWYRGRVKELHFSEGSGYDEAITFDGKTVQLTPEYTALLQFTGQFDIDANPIFDAALVVDEDDSVWEVIFADASFMLRRDEETKPLNTENSMKVRIVGDAIRDAKLIVPSNGVEVLEAAEKKAADAQQGV